MSLFTLLLSLVVLAACGGSGDAPPAQAPADNGQAAAPAESGEGVTITMWTKEGEADNSLQFVKSLADEFAKANPNIKIEVVKKKDVEELREDFQTSALAGSSPDLLWTVNDHAGPFTVAELIQPVDDLFDLAKFVPGAVEAVKLDGQTWGVPISTGNHLMLYYNKDLMPEPPANTDELIAKGQEVSGDATPLVFNQTEAFWLVPWLGGFGGQVFAEDGVTPTLDTPAMVDTLNFLHQIKFTDKIIPPESDYDTADTLFKEGKAAMIINGDWTLSAYVDTLGDKLGVARIPQVSATGEWPKPYTAGTYFMIPAAVEGAKLDAVKAFIDYVTSKDTQLQQVAELKRLPSLQEALDDPSISNDPQLAGVIDQLQVGTGMPAVLEMRCNWDAMKPEMQAVLADQKSAEDAAKAMQEAAVNCIKTLE
ncbi:MAG: extracellular solute-binding protein [Anaerolineaceae bacterium]|nr:extracellular solute-binding protein [Anaerolineaceae bacterium]MCB9101954.1 extracellular solute-binding protein [Anaerolineales bacterium]